MVNPVAYLFRVRWNRLSLDIVIPAKAGIQEPLHPIPRFGPGLSGFRLKAGMTVRVKKDFAILNSYLVASSFTISAAPLYNPYIPNYPPD